MNSKTITFMAVSKGGELLPEPCAVYMRCGDVRIMGEDCKTVYNPKTWKYGRVTGLFVAYKGDEYGTIDMTQNEFLTECNCGASTQGHVRLFEKAFGLEFE